VIDKPESLLNRATKPEAKPVSSPKAVSESPNGDDAKPDSDIEPTSGAKNVQEAANVPEGETAPGTEKAPGAEKAADTKKAATTLIEPDPTTSPRNDALVDEQDTPEQTDESAYEQTPDGVREDVVKEDIARPNEPRASDDQAPLLKRDKPSMPVPSASEERLVPTSRLGGSARELLNDDGSLRKP
jgi:hypothetical protein